MIECVCQPQTLIEKILAFSVEVVTGKLYSPNPVSLGAIGAVADKGSASKALESCIIARDKPEFASKTKKIPQTNLDCIDFSSIV